MIPFLLVVLFAVTLFFYYRKQKRLKREIAVFAVLSLASVAQLYTLLTDKPFRITAVIAAVVREATSLVQ
ncbi:hypothetical protein DFQ01_101356 [Paenibacillus cellulosilyticus]|uniref:Uncharacterized protein n=1 Tax=Paenibacillus cellulosilyticus TaxID=375489 RepID=A0A2V2Z1D9_9BACL|nr:hypothetical protein [Paenibacillus cellulosilyticus]PWW08632.1 hypothetical protein DFQ01_101356 [Paenibacillus cellulosilyticus]QKS48199.1 hypothetical protein HUB94_28400 [Paenibacillus cellulosilyticus]